MYKIVLVDDEELVLKSLLHTVEWEKYGFSVVDMASSGREAYEKIMELNPDLVMTDIRMQGISGLELVQLVKQERPEVYCVILSGYAEFAYAKKAMELGAVGYCLKPFQEEEIVSYLKKIKDKLDERKKAEKKIRIENAESTEKKIRKSVNKNQTYVDLVNYVNEHYMDDVSPQILAEVFHIRSILLI